MAQQKKARKVGRPKLPKGAAQGRIVPVRFRRDDLNAIEQAAKAHNQTVSQWVRSKIHAMIHQFTTYCPTCKQVVIASIPMSRMDLINALESDAEIPFVHPFPLALDHKSYLTKEQKETVREHIANGTF